MNFFFRVCCWVVVITVLFGGPVKGAEDRLHVDPLKQGDVASDGAWFFWFLSGPKANKVIKVAELDITSGELVVRINGKAERLDRTSQAWVPHRDSGPRIGDKCEEVWTDGRVKVRLSYTLLDQGEELSVFSGQMHVSANGETRTLEVRGETGA